MAPDEDQMFRIPRREHGGRLIPTLARLTNRRLNRLRLTNKTRLTRSKVQHVRLECDMAVLADICKVLGEWRNVQKYADADDVEILFNICSNHEVTVKQLLLSSAGSRSTILRRLRSLVERGLVTANPVARDRRARQLNLTAKGMRWATQIVQSLEGLSQTVTTMDKARR
jgi:hypothetical protein